MQAYCCEHLRDLEVALREMNFRIQHDGRTWWQSDKPGHWVYFDCYLEPVALREIQPSDFRRALRIRRKDGRPGVWFQM